MSEQPRVFDHEDLTGAQFRHVDLTDARFANALLRDVVISETDLDNVRIDGADLNHVVINGVDVAPLIIAELDRRDPERVLMRPTDPDGYRSAWDLVERRWAETVDRARSLPPQALHESVDGEWSFVQTLRHLLYATDVWFRRVVLGEPRPWHALDLPFDGMTPHPEVPWDRDARPSLEEVVALRRDRMDGVRTYLDSLDRATLDSRTAPVEGPGWPPPDAYPVAEALRTVLNEEWAHRGYAERDLAVVESRSAHPAD
jgi:uncharacterized protein YjbI with pentapeptide repeats